MLGDALCACGLILFAHAVFAGLFCLWALCLQAFCAVAKVCGRVIISSVLCWRIRYTCGCAMLADMLCLGMRYALVGLIICARCVCGLVLLVGLCLQAFCASGRCVRERAYVLA